MTCSHDHTASHVILASSAARQESWLTTFVITPNVMSQSLISLSQLSPFPRYYTQFDPAWFSLVICLSQFRLNQTLPGRQLISAWPTDYNSSRHLIALVTVMLPVCSDSQWLLYFQGFARMLGCTQICGDYPWAALDLCSLCCSSRQWIQFRLPSRCERRRRQT